MAEAPIPFVSLAATDGPLTEELVAAVRAHVESTAYIGGHAVAGFEAAMAERLGTKLVGLGVAPGHGVVVPAFTYNATAAAVVRAGGTPVLVDVDPDTLNMDPQALATVAAAVENVHAAIPVHLFGLPADMNGCVAAAESAGIALLEDAAQAIGATWKGRPAGQLAATRWPAGTAGSTPFRRPCSR